MVKFKCAILISVYSRLTFSKNIKKNNERKFEEKENLSFKCKLILFERKSFIQCKKTFKVVESDHLRNCPVRYLENIRTAIVQFDWLILVIGPMN